MISIKNTSKSYKGKQAVSGLSLSVTGGEIYGLLGPNGAGKQYIKYVTRIPNVIAKQLSLMVQTQAPIQKMQGSGQATSRKTSIFILI